MKQYYGLNSNWIFYVKMVRFCKKKTERTIIDENFTNSTISDAFEGNLSIRKIAEKYNMKASALQHKIERKIIQKPNV